MAQDLRNQGCCVSRKRVRRLMAKTGLRAAYQTPRTTAPHPEPHKYPYLLRNLVIERPSEAWCAAIAVRRAGHPLEGPLILLTPMQRGFLHLAATMDGATRRAPAWRLSDTTDAAFCIGALEEAVARHGRPEIFDTEHGGQCASPRFTRALLDATVKIAMDGRGRWMDTVMIERLWRSLKHECVCPHAFGTGSAARAGVGEWIDFYTFGRSHSAPGGRTPVAAHQGHDLKAAA